MVRIEVEMVMIKKEANSYIPWVWIWNEDQKKTRCLFLRVLIEKLLISDTVGVHVDQFDFNVLISSVGDHYFVVSW